MKELSKEILDMQGQYDVMNLKIVTETTNATNVKKLGDEKAALLE